MASSPDGLFLLFFRSVYLSMTCGFAAFTFLGFSRLGTAVGLIATIIVAVGSEISFICQRREYDLARKARRFMV
jgi:hypothetical protein